MAAQNRAAANAACELLLTRAFDAPRDLVYEAWTDPARLACWWGPKGFTNPVCEVDARPGGAIRIDMRGPDGAVYPMTGTFVETARPERLVFISRALEDAGGNAGLEVHNTVTFAEKGGRTTLTLVAVVQKVTPAAEGAVAGMDAGWSQSLERLAGEVADGSREIRATRLIDAPRDLVFRMWTDPKHVGRWWGPRGFTTTIAQMDVRPGGVWQFVMHGPDGRDYPNRIVYVDVVAPERIVYDHVSGPLFRMTATFAEEDGKTRLNVRRTFKSADLRNRVVQEFRAEEGLGQTLDRLLAESAAAVAGEFVLERVFDAPRDLLWKAWTESDRLAQWWGPKGFTMVHCSVDLRPGGLFHYQMRSPDGHEMWGKFVFREVTPPQRLVFLVSFSDAQAGTLRHPLSAEWPLEVLNTVTFTERGGKTVLTVRGIPHNATEAERNLFANSHKSLDAGFSGTMQQLAEYLARA